MTPFLILPGKWKILPLHDEYFIEKHLYPNVDFYSGILLRTIGLQENMFTVIFAIARLAGWIAHWREGALEKNARIQRPRQIYIGLPERPFPMAKKAFRS